MRNGRVRLFGESTVCHHSHRVFGFFFAFDLHVLIFPSFYNSPLVCPVLLLDELGGGGLDLGDDGLEGVGHPAAELGGGEAGLPAQQAGHQGAQPRVARVLNRRP